MLRLLKQHWQIITISALFVIARVATLRHHEIASWDAAVYVGMGKYLFSHGTIGTWEALRPVGVPVLLGAAWKLGLNPYTVGIVFSVITSTALLVLTYVFGEQVRKGAGSIAAVLVATTAVFFIHSALPVTDITATFFSLLSLFLTYKAATNRQYLVAGIIVALAFLFRFPHGLLLVVDGLLIIVKTAQSKGKWSIRFEYMIERVFTLAGGFFALVIPFLIINYYAYGNPFLPFIEGTQVVTLYPALYAKGAWFYVIGLLKQEPLYMLALLPIGMYWKKKYRHLAVTALGIALLVVGGYFLYQSHKELRYALAFLPYVAILSGVGIVYVLDYFALPLLAFFGLFGLVAFMVAAPMIVHPYQHPDTSAFYAFDTYLQNAPKARVMSSTAYTFAYTDVLLTRNLYGDWNDAYLAYTGLRQDNDYIALDSCNLEMGCKDNIQCMDKKQTLLSLLDKQDDKVFSMTTPSQCMLLIYKIRH